MHQSILAAHSPPPPPPGYCGAFAGLVSPGVGGGGGVWAQLELTDALYSSICSLVVFLFRATIGRLCIFTALETSPSSF